MPIRQPRYSKEEYGRMGRERYEKIRPHVEEGHKGKIVAIDIETGEYEIAEDVLEASDRLFGRVGDAQPWIVRIGYPAVHRLGGRVSRGCDDRRHGQ